MDLQLNDISFCGSKKVWFSLWGSLLGHPDVPLVPWSGVCWVWNADTSVWANFNIHFITMPKHSLSVRLMWMNLVATKGRQSVQRSEIHLKIVHNLCWNLNLEMLLLIGTYTDPPCKYLFFESCWTQSSTNRYSTSVRSLIWLPGHVYSGRNNIFADGVLQKDWVCVQSYISHCWVLLLV